MLYNEKDEELILSFSKRLSTREDFKFISDFLPSYSVNVRTVTAELRDKFYATQQSILKTHSLTNPPKPATLGLAAQISDGFVKTFEMIGSAAGGLIGGVLSGVGKGVSGLFGSLLNPKTLLYAGGACIAGVLVWKLITKENNNSNPQLVHAGGY